MGFAAMLAEVNGLREKGFRQWVFASGMEFLAERQWWGLPTRRATAHEGVDFQRYETIAGGRLGELAAGTLVPAALAGEVVRIHDDFLGRTVWLAHGFADGEGWGLYSVYGHLAPAFSSAAGEQVAAGAIIGTVADPALVGRKIAPHLHLTVARVSGTVAPAHFNWSLVQDPTRVTLLDPLFL